VTSTTTVVRASALTRLGPAALGVATLLLLLIAIEVLIRAGFINNYIVPTPIQVAAAFERIIVDEDIGSRFLLTFTEAFTAGAMITVVGVLAGVLLYRFDLLRRATETWVAALASAPTVLMYPLFLVIFGRSAWTIIMMGFVAGLPPVILKTIEGLVTTRRVLVDVGRSFRANTWQMATKIYLPAMRHPIINGVRLGLGVAIIGTLLAETKLSNSGIGFLIIQAYTLFDMPRMYAMLIVVFVLAIGANALVGWVGRLDRVKVR